MFNSHLYEANMRDFFLVHDIRQKMKWKTLLNNLQQYNYDMSLNIVYSVLRLPALHKLQIRP